MKDTQRLASGAAPYRWIEVSRCLSLSSWLSVRVKESKLAFGSTFVDVADCDQLAEAIDPHCTFSADTVEQFTQEVVAHNGDYTIFFWVRKPDASQSKAQFVPGFTWFSSLSPPQHPVFQLAVRAGATEHYLMQGQTFTCGDERHTAGVNMVEAGPVSEDDWTLIVLTRHNDTDHPTMSGELTDESRHLVLVSRCEARNEGSIG